MTTEALKQAATARRLQPYPAETAPLYRVTCTDGRTLEWSPRKPLQHSYWWAASEIGDILDLPTWAGMIYDNGGAVCTMTLERIGTLADRSYRSEVSR